MWLTSSSIGRKLVMAITGACLVLFVTFHVLMNSVAILWPAAYNDICLFLGANWYALIASAGLAALFILHIIYALWLTMQNRKARGHACYVVTTRPPQVEWSSKNMLVLGIVVLAFLGVHLIQFWAKMQLQELVGHNPTSWYTVNGAAASPAMGTLFIQEAFSHWYTPVIYIIGFVALWFHMNHGVWSMFQSTGWNGKHWLERLKCIALWWTSIVIALFIVQAVVFTVQANGNHYTSDVHLQEQYAEEWGATAETVLSDFNKEYASAIQKAEGANQQDVAKEVFLSKGPKFIEDANVIIDNYKKQCPDAFNEHVMQLEQSKDIIERQMQFFSNPAAASQPALN